MNQDSAPSSAPSTGRGAASSRTVRMDSRAAERRTAELLDDAIRVNERGAGVVSNASIGDACGVNESKVRAWRDPHAGKPMTLYRLLQLPDPVFRGLVERLQTARAELRADLGPESATVAAALAIASMGRALSDIGAAIADGAIDEREASALRSLLLAVQRDSGVLLKRLEPKAGASGR